ncbi:hypothetical protein [Homoserinimonas hongtaonis]|uniref:Uncharacterized protein n=1 Tax=Homoserinimonas hongtaonis TaxID=2079791 RepID=A0A2U1SZ31_9MICO|nr:hypothetical protein [Salinibacterium hongtaonis]PWB96877.1 hypothetical protein DF220_02790 [Salinibacterium hongtaonis]
MSLSHAEFAAAYSAAPVSTIATVIVAGVVLLGAIGMYLRHIHTSAGLSRTHTIGAIVSACAVTVATLTLTVSLATVPPASAEPPILQTDDTEAVQPSDAPGLQLPTLSVE